MLSHGMCFTKNYDADPSTWEIIGKHSLRMDVCGPPEHVIPGPIALMCDYVAERAFCLKNWRGSLINCC
ncbi:hypothetical protein AQUCO_01900202v1 [Aquilegia coerulea]|uniref:Uncharacterized protein n=1 Tax=Aquilegia coerulea TaxID=218851 RepID=A0A2G5DK53_AQUCA|nr:hypothetical protein AQUCO_01900202v1 [Aquilegia coerulea]